MIMQLTTFILFQLRPIYYYRYGRWIQAPSKHAAVKVIWQKVFAADITVVVMIPARSVLSHHRDPLAQNRRRLLWKSEVNTADSAVKQMH